MVVHHPAAANHVEKLFERLWFQRDRLPLLNDPAHLLERFHIEIVVGHGERDRQVILVFWQRRALRARTERTEFDRTALVADGHRHDMVPHLDK